MSICSLLYYILNHKYKDWVYLVSFLSGISLSICLNTGVSFISDVVGFQGKSGAFVYGCYGLLDKFGCGFILFFIMQSDAFESRNEEFIKLTFIFIPLVSYILALFLMKIGKSG